MSDTLLLNAEATARALPYPALIDALRSLLQDPAVQVPPRLIQPLPGGASLFVMPAHDARLAMTKLITFVPNNTSRGLPSIQGDILVFEVASGRRVALLDGPTVTARRTAAVSVLAAQLLAPRRDGPLLIVGAGVQGHSHLEAFHAGLGVEEVWIASRSTTSADALVRHAQALGMRARRVEDANAALAHCPLVVSATPAQAAVMHTLPRDDAFVAAVGAFNPRMLEWAPEVCQQLAQRGRLVVDTRDADHEAGDLLQAGIDVATLPSLADVLRQNTPTPAEPGANSSPVFFKSCGWAGWDLAAARCAAGLRTPVA
jgi:1-piperideine-2-carboxylate/1-pyrroline-2-carboxylate reductase [NAD(P)H]